MVCWVIIAELELRLNFATQSSDYLWLTLTVKLGLILRG